MKALLTVLLVCFIFACKQDAKNVKKWDRNNGLVQNNVTAEEIAEAVWLQIYGEKIYEEKPFNTTLKDGKVWIVRGSLNAELGGVAYIEIQKSNGRILKVTHGK